MGPFCSSFEEKEKEPGNKVAGCITSSVWNFTVRFSAIFFTAGNTLWGHEEKTFP